MHEANCYEWVGVSFVSVYVCMRAYAHTFICIRKDILCQMENNYIYHLSDCLSICARQTFFDKIWSVNSIKFEEPWSI